ncbi:MAG: hypothetical protein LAN63_09035 [Acidobacteriia bacterium]|nr:hypothetical protein [Terriglobia bacterium]
MDSETIIILVLSAGAVAFLVWVEINSRRNEANIARGSTLAQGRQSPLQKQAQSKVEPDTKKTKAA